MILVARGGSRGGALGARAPPLEKREIIFGMLKNKKVTANCDVGYVLSRKLSEKEDKEDGGAYFAI